LVDTEAIKRQVLEWTGQSDIKSLDPYIHLAFAKFANFTKTLDAVCLGRLVDSMRTTVQVIRQEVGAGMPPTEAALKLVTLAEAVEADLVRLHD